MDLPLENQTRHPKSCWAPGCNTGQHVACAALARKRAVLRGSLGSQVHR